MYCENCGKEIIAESNFCKFCGIRVADDNTNELPKPRNEQPRDTSLWDKFAEIYDSDKEERDKYIKLSSDEAWELIGRLGKNSFEDFIEENKSLLNEQPYKVIETLENTYKVAVIGGYWIWMSEYILKNGDSWKLKKITLDDFINEWTIRTKKTSDFINNISADLDKAITIFQNFKINDFLENCPSIKELPNDFIEKLKLDILIKILWGYFIGITEAKYIK